MTETLNALLNRFTRCSPPATEQTPITVLVVDDEEPIRVYVDRVLTRAGYRTTLAESAATALKIAETSGPFDVLLTDLHMPEINGEELARRMRAERADLPVLFLTGYSDQLFQERVELPDGEAFLDKPCTPRGLLDAVSLVRNTKYVTVDGDH